MEFSHELVIPNEDLPFKMFLFEGKDGGYFRDKHWHRSIEIFAVFEGALDFYLNNEICPLHPGEFMLVNSNEIHSIASPLPNRTVVLQIPLKTFEDYYTGEQYIRFTHKNQLQDCEIMELIRKMYCAYDGKQCGYQLKVKGLYFQLLFLMVTEYRELNVTPDMLKKNKKLNRLSSITSYIRDHYTEDLSLELLAEIFGYTPAYLSRMFQKYAGINYKTYLQSVRLEEAYKELVNTDHTISQVALNNGFPNNKAFAREFRSKYGVLPSEYRRSRSHSGS